MRYTYCLKSIVTGVCIILGLSSCNKSEKVEDKAATQALATFKSILNSPGHPKMVLDSILAADSLKLGAPVKVYYIERTDITALHIADSSIRYTNRLVYPIYTAHDSLVSSEELELDQGVWTARRFGEKAAITLYMQNLKNTSGSGFSNPYLVRVPSLNMSFIGGTIGGATNLKLLSQQSISSFEGDSISKSTPYTIPALFEHLKNLEKDAGAAPM